MTPADFNLRHLRALAETLRRGGFSAAARALGISQPAVTQAIGRLESLTGLRLVERGAGQQRPTDAGILLSARAEAAHAAMTEAFASRRRGGIGGHAGAAENVTMPQAIALLAVADAGSYAGAAAQLGFAQPSVHRSVAALEQACGVALVARQGRGIGLTAAGDRLAAACRLAMAELQAALDELAVLAGRDQGAIRIAAHPAALAWILPAAIARFLIEHPPVMIDVQAVGDPDADAERLRTAKVDALVTLADDRLRSLFAIHPLLDDPLTVAARVGHPLSSGGAPGLVRLASFGWALPPPASSEREAWERMFVDGGLYPPEASVSCPSRSALVELTARTDLLTVASREQVDRAAGRLVAIGTALKGNRQLVLATRTGWAPTPAQAAFFEELRGGAGAFHAF